MSTDSVHGPLSIPQELLVAYEKYREVYERRPSWKDLGEGELWQELCFCILSSNVPYEMARSASVQLSQRGLLDIDALEGRSAIRIAAELSRPVYQPERRDGSLRVYRFPRRRAHDIVGAWEYLYSESSGLVSLLETRSPPDVRMTLVSNVPGIGFKEASHFLRDVKFADSLAVLDSHVVSFLSLFVYPLAKAHGMTPRNYIRLEALLVSFARRLGLNPAILDMAIWEYMRNS